MCASAATMADVTRRRFASVELPCRWSILQSRNRLVRQILIAVSREIAANVATMEAATMRTRAAAVLAVMQLHSWRWPVPLSTRFSPG